MKRTCLTCRNRYRSQCVSDDVVGSNPDSDIEGEPQTREGVAILDWMADSLYARGDEVAVRKDASPCPGWGRR
jgi:hypothetical protein